MTTTEQTYLATYCRIVRDASDPTKFAPPSLRQQARRLEATMSLEQIDRLRETARLLVVAEKKLAS